MWGFSSAGRAPALHAGGQEFESPNLHHKKPNDICYSVFYYARQVLMRTPNVRKHILRVRTTCEQSAEDFDINYRKFDILVGSFLIYLKYQNQMYRVLLYPNLKQVINKIPRSYLFYPTRFLKALKVNLQFY